MYREPTPQDFQGVGVFLRHILISQRHRSPATSPSTHSNSLSFSSSCQLIALGLLMLYGGSGGNGCFVFGIISQTNNVKPKKVTRGMTA